MNIKRDILFRVVVVMMSIVSLCGGVIYKIFQTQSNTVEVQKLILATQKTSIKTQKVSPIRGNIYACDGSLMATSIPIYRVSMDTRKQTIHDSIWNKHIDSLAFYLSNLFPEKSAEQYKADLCLARNKKVGSYLIKNKVYHTTLTQMKEFPIFREGKYKGGFIAEDTTKRIRPFPLAERLIGYNNPNVKPVGLEGAYNNYLMGSIGKRVVRRVSGGNWIPVSDIDQVESIDGKDIYTHIDLNIQDVTTQALRKALITHGAAKGCAVVMEVNTGGIKAMANLQMTQDSQYAEILNHAVIEATEPGSTFKIVSAMAMLDLTSIKPYTRVSTNGGVYYFNGKPMKDSKEGGYGVIDLHQGFEVSSNVAISRLMNDVFANEPEKFTNYISHLKLDKPLGLPLKGEGKPYFNNPKSKHWSNLSIPWMSVGYELKLTPLQILTLYNAVANNGVMVKPQFVKDIKQVGKTIQHFEPEIMVNEICAPTTLEAVKKMAEGVVENGTAKHIRSAFYKIAGKTGTAQVANEEGGYKKQHRYQASFVGYFPADKPKYSIIVVIYYPSKGNYYGGSVAAPVFKEIADKIYASTFPVNQKSKNIIDTQYLSISSPRNHQDIYTLAQYLNLKTDALQNAPEWISPQLSFQTKEIKANGVSFKKKVMPNLNGMLLSDAIYLLENQGMRVKFQGKGKITKQSIEPGQPIKYNQEILLTLN